MITKTCTMRKLVLQFALLLGMMMAVSGLNAQDYYKSAVGGRLGYPLSLSFKYFLNESHAVEAYVGTRGWSGYRWTNVSAAYLVHKPLELDGVEGLRWYFGGGASVYFWSFDDSFLLDDDYNTTTIGAQAYLGLDYTFEDIPLNLTIDWVPTFFFNGFGNGFGGGYGTVGVRYILAR